MPEEDIHANSSTYRIKVRGRLDQSWSDWCGGLAIACREESDGFITILTGAVADQAALRGLLCRLWDLNLALISVVRVGVKIGGEIDD